MPDCLGLIDCIELGHCHDDGSQRHVAGLHRIDCFGRENPHAAEQSDCFGRENHHAAENRLDFLLMMLRRLHRDHRDV